MTVGDGWDCDWTQCPGDFPRELARREVRNQLATKQLQSRRSVGFRQSGWSCYPDIWDDDLCCYEPIDDWRNLRLGDIVFCAVQPGRRYYAHPIKEIGWWKGQPCFTIANLAGRVNGWCYKEDIYGILVEVVGRGTWKPSGVELEAQRNRMG